MTDFAPLWLHWRSFLWVPGAVLILCAVLVFYLASHQQRLLARRMKFRPAMLSGLGLMLAGTGGFCMVASPLVAVFMAFVWLMLGTSLLPVVIALVQRRGAAS